MWLQIICYVRSEGQLTTQAKLIPEVENIQVSILETGDDICASEIIKVAKIVEEIDTLNEESIVEVEGRGENVKEDRACLTNSRIGMVIKRTNRFWEK